VAATTREATRASEGDWFSWLVAVERERQRDRERESQEVKYAAFPTPLDHHPTSFSCCLVVVVLLSGTAVRVIIIDLDDSLRTVIRWMGRV
jgi:hypothetical protein